MLALHIHVNDKSWTVGVGDDGAAHAVLALTQGRFQQPYAGQEKDTGARFTVTGIRAHAGVTDQLRWLDYALAKGDRISIEIVEAATIDPAVVVEQPDRDRKEQLARAQIEQLRKQLRDLEARYPE